MVIFRIYATLKLAARFNKARIQPASSQIEITYLIYFEIKFSRLNVSSKMIPIQRLALSFPLPNYSHKKGTSVFFAIYDPLRVGVCVWFTWKLNLSRISFLLSPYTFSSDKQYKVQNINFCSKISVKWNGTSPLVCVFEAAH